MEKLIAFGIEFLHYNEFLTPTKYEFSNAINHLNSRFHARPLSIVKMNLYFNEALPYRARYLNPTSSHLHLCETLLMQRPIATRAAPSVPELFK
jgi:hypothetical protein